MKIGILGGTFDPIHYGHLIVGQEVFERLNLDEIWFMPNRIPPHKEGTVFLNDFRKKLIQLAIEDVPHFSLQTFELDREETSYTYNTIVALKEIYPEYEFYFIIGGDMVEYLPKWYRIDDLVQLVSFVGVTRPGYELKTSYPVQFVHIHGVDISSSFIRSKLSSGKSIRFYVPDEVRIAIEESEYRE